MEEGGHLRDQGGTAGCTLTLNNVFVVQPSASTDPTPIDSEGDLFGYESEYGLFDLGIRSDKGSKCEFNVPN
jgi:hypothetical protein